MKRTSFAEWECSVARTADVVAEVWTPLILRDLFLGVRRFGDLLDSLGVARNILSDRLRTLVDRGIVTKVAYQERPARYEYHLTEKGADLMGVLLAMLAWGDRWEGDGGGPPMAVVHRGCGRPCTPTTACSACGAPLGAGDVRLVPRDPPSPPGAGAAVV